AFEDQSGVFDASRVRGRRFLPFFCHRRHPIQAGHTRTAKQKPLRLVQTPRGIRVTDENMAELSLLCGYDDDLTKQAATTSNRFRGLLTQIHPGMETMFGFSL